MKSILFIYKKEKVVKALDLDDSNHQELIDQGFKHVSTLNMKAFIENIFNNTPEDEWINDLKSILR